MSGCRLPPLGDALGRRVGELEVVQRERTQAWNQLVHRRVELGGGVGDQLRGLLRGRIGIGLAARERQREAADRCQALSHFVVQLARDVRALVLDARLHDVGELAALLEPQPRIGGLGARIEVVLDRGRHAVERERDLAGLGAGERRQARVERAALDVLEAALDRAERLRRAAHEPEHQHVAENDHEERRIRAG